MPHLYQYPSGQLVCLRANMPHLYQHPSGQLVVGVTLTQLVVKVCETRKMVRSSLFHERTIQPYIGGRQAILLERYNKKAAKETIRHNH